MGKRDNAIFSLRVFMGIACITHKKPMEFGEKLINDFMEKHQAEELSQDLAIEFAKFIYKAMEEYDA